jgi:hypothetical protein
MYGPFGLELAKIHIEDLCAGARTRSLGEGSEKGSRRKACEGGGPPRWRRIAGRALIGAGARVGRIRVLSVPPGAERGRA